MIFEKDSVAFNILSVVEINQSNVKSVNTGRNFDALSFRYDSDVIIKTDKNTYNFKNNSVCFFPSGVNYTRFAKKDNIIAINFDSLNYFSKEIEYFFPENDEIFLSLFKRILKLWTKKETGYKHKCSAVMCDILAECYKLNHKEKGCNPKIKNSVDYINKNFKSFDISVKTAAEKSFISEVYLRKLFKIEFGISPRRYIINLRMQNAIGLISMGYYSLKEIALMSGFADYKYFSTEFKAYTGKCPSEYLKFLKQKTV